MAYRLPLLGTLVLTNEKGKAKEPWKSGRTKYFLYTFEARSLAATFRAITKSPYRIARGGEGGKGQKDGDIWNDRFPDERSEELR